MDKKKIGIISLGCDKNRVDSEKMLYEMFFSQNNSSTGGYSVSNANDDRDMDLKIQALKIAIETKKASISYFQREFRISFNKAASIQDWMVKEGFITVLEGKKVQINITMDQFKQKFGGA